MPDLGALLDRIGLASPPPATVTGLRTLHRAYVDALPYEALAITLGEFEPLELDAIAGRLVAGRGGYCFELNAVLAWLLEECGFVVTRREAIVGPRGEARPVNHLALVVTIDGAPWLADAGLGEGPLEPLPLRPGTYEGAPGSPLHWTVQDGDGDGHGDPDAPADDWWLLQHRWGTVGSFHITDRTVDLNAFQPHHQRLSTDPESSFVQTLVVQRPLTDRIITLRARTLSVDGPRRHERRVLADAPAFAAALHDPLGLDLDTLGPERIARLWAAAEEQHERFIANLVR